MYLCVCGGSRLFKNTNCVSDNLAASLTAISLVQNGKQVKRMRGKRWELSEVLSTDVTLFPLKVMGILTLTSMGEELGQC